MPVFCAQSNTATTGALCCVSKGVPCVPSPLRAHTHMHRHHIRTAHAVLRIEDEVLAFIGNRERDALEFPQAYSNYQVCVCVCVSGGLLLLNVHAHTADAGKKAWVLRAGCRAFLHDPLHFTRLLPSSHTPLLAAPARTQGGAIPRPADQQHGHGGPDRPRRGAPSAAERGDQGAQEGSTHTGAGS